MKKVLLSIGLSILITLSLTGCNLFDGSKDTTTSQKSSVDTTQNKSSVDKDTSSQSEDKQTKTTIKDNSSGDENTVKQDTPKTQKQTVGKITFCEYVDSNLNAVNSSTRFTTGEIYARLQSSTTFNTTSIKITLSYVDGASESIIDSIVEDVDPSWSVYAFPVTTVSPGKYKVTVIDYETNKKIGEGTFTAE